MTREEAIQVLQEKIDDRPLFKDEREAFMVAIEALKAEPNCQKCAIKELWKETEKEDLVSVVRCMDCKWAEKAILDEYCVECTMYHTSCMKHGYCHHGERQCNYFGERREECT